MVTVLNPLIECIVTGLATALFLLFFGKMGWLPFMIIMTEEDLPPQDTDLT